MLRAFCTRGLLKKISLSGEARYFAESSYYYSGSHLKQCRIYCNAAKKDLEEQVKKNLHDNNDFNIIYRFPYIKLARGICRLKLYQTTLTGFAVPIVGYFTYIEVLPSQALFSTLAISGLAFFMLYVMGELFRRIVGIIYSSSKKDLVKVSHLTFWGGRKDIVIPTEDIVPFSDTAEIPTDIYVKLSRYSCPSNPLYLCLKFGGIIDSESFMNVFGKFHTK